MEETIVNLISNVGFPIVVSIGLFYQMIKTNEQANVTNQNYMQLLREFKQVIDNNTQSLDQLNKAVRDNDERSN